MRKDAFVWLAAIAVATIVAHSCGYAFGVANQATYFLEALHRAHPELLKNDWLVTSTTTYHSVFSALAGYVFRWDDSGAFSFGVIHVVFMIALLCGVFLVVRGSTERSAFAVFVLVAGWLAVNGERSVAGSYIWSSYLQPSLIGAAGWMIALGFHVRGRPLATGIALALGGVFHVNFLILGIGVFGLAEVIADRQHLVRRLALFVAPQLLAVLVLLPEILANASASDPDRALWVLVQFHAPLHYRPMSILRTLPSLVRWVALAIVVAPIALDVGRRPAVRRLLIWCTIAGGLCVVVTVVALIPPFLVLTRFYVWRLAPFAIAAAQIAIALAVAGTLAEPSLWREQPMWRRAAAIVLALWIAVRAPFMLPAAADWVPWLVIGAVALAFAVPAHVRRFLFPITAAITLAAPLAYRRHEIVHPPTGVASDEPNYDGLYAWARASSPVDAVFLTPPDLFRFRLVARRAIYADFKSPPLAPDGLVAWHQRLCQMTGAPPDEKVPAQRKRWLDATGDELLARANQLGVDYLILDRTPAHDRIAATPVYRNDGFAVFAAR